MKQKAVMMIVGAIFVLSFALSGCGADLQATGEAENASQTGSQQSNSPTSSHTNASSQITNIQTEKATVTIPEGFTWTLIAKRLEANGICSAQAFYQACQNYSPKSFSIPENENRPFKMEGYLYPATYAFEKGSDAQDVVIEMLNAYRNNTGGSLTDSELIVASIVQMETRSVEHMSMIAGIIYNRLEQGMQLQMDSTREYINDYVTNHPLLNDTAKYAALYNTYKCPQLPAGPICSPGADAIYAAKNPTPSNYLYFFFGNDHENHYSSTYEEHQAAMAQFGVQYGESTQ